MVILRATSILGGQKEDKGMIYSIPLVIDSQYFAYLPTIDLAYIAYDTKKKKNSYSQCSTIPCKVNVKSNN
jgi:hypothetical protein